MASVRKRKWTHNGVEKEAWVVSYTDQSGARRLKTFDKKKEADRYRTQVEVEVENGTHVVSNQSILVKDAAKEFLKHCDARHRAGSLSGHCLYGYANLTKNAVIPMFGGKKCCDVTESDLADAVQKWSASYSPRTVHARVSLLREFFKYCFKRRWARANVVDRSSLEMPRVKKRTAIPSKADVKALLEATSVIRKREPLVSFVNRRLMVTLGVFGGLRPGEMLALQWEDIDLASGHITVRHSLSRYDGLKEPKSAAGVRAVPINPLIENALLEVAGYYQAVSLSELESPNGDRKLILAHARKKWLECKQADPSAMTGFVIKSQHGGPLCPASTTSDLWKEVMDKAGLCTDDDKKRPLFTMHAMRHAAVSLFIEAGLRPLPLKTVIGHASVSTTYNVYGHLFPEDDTITAASASIAAQFADATRERQGAPLH